MQKVKDIKKKNQVWRALLFDILAAGILLLTFAYYDHGKDYLAGRRELQNIDTSISEDISEKESLVPSEVSAEKAAEVNHGENVQLQTAEKSNSASETASEKKPAEVTQVTTEAKEETKEAEPEAKPEAEDKTKVQTEPKKSAETERNAPKSTECQNDSAFKFEQFMSKDTVVTEDSYRSQDISFTIRKYDKENGVLDTRYLVANIYVRDPHCIKSYFAGGTYSSGRSHVSSLQLLSKEAEAILSINGDYYISQNESMVLRNGELYREPTMNYDALALYEDGTMKVFDGSELMTEEQIQSAAKNAWQIWSFGPSLLDSEGKAIIGLEHRKTGISARNPRTAIGYYEPGHYCFVIVEGRRASAKGCTFDELAFLMEKLGCTVAYNLDGGASSSMVFDGKLISDPPKERSIPDIIYLAECEKTKESEQ